MIWYKMDGSSVVLDYVNGNLIRGASRGDGTIGVDYTENIKKMGGVVQTLKDLSFTGSVRGEVLLSKSNNFHHPFTLLEILKYHNKGYV